MSKSYGNLDCSKCRKETPHTTAANPLIGKTPLDGLRVQCMVCGSVSELHLTKPELPNRNRHH
jgi:hypothetical protein